MIEFMILGGPRSATSWMSNWLTTDKTYCFHDPLTEYKIPRLEQVTIPGRRLGISCTCSYLYPNWVLNHKARKILLYRPIEEINRAHDAIGLQRIDPEVHNRLFGALADAGIPVWDWQAPFQLKLAVDIWRHLLPDIPFDPYRWNLLVGLNCQPQFNRRAFGREAIEDLKLKLKDVLI